MTRKRFVKLLMARGWQRNRANTYAIICRENGYSYANYYEWCILGAKYQGTSSMHYYARNFMLRGEVFGHEYD